MKMKLFILAVLSMLCSTVPVLAQISEQGLTPVASEQPQGTTSPATISPATIVPKGANGDVKDIKQGHSTVRSEIKDEGATTVPDAHPMLDEKTGKPSAHPDTSR